jgi:hypothetical protein
MRVLIRNEKTGKYLGRDGFWVSEAKTAMAFPTLQVAGEKARQHENCGVVLSYEDPKCELAVDPMYCV